MIPGGVLQLEDGTWQVWCNIQDGREKCGTFKTLAKAKKSWVDAEVAYNHRAGLKPSDAPVYKLKTVAYLEAERIK